MRRTIRKLRESIFLIAFLAGMFVGTATLFQFSTNPVKWFEPILRSMCTVVEGVDIIYAQCNAFISYSILFSIVFALLAIVYHISKKGNWRKGLLIYVGGWILGFIISIVIWILILG